MWDAAGLVGKLGLALQQNQVVILLFEYVKESNF